ncbi:hypothetical protein B0H17DRAFT_1157680 [Mycena rosella]|uniref:Pre-mRNA-splicing factor Syf1/CRNKL1-like C-terminal HAT-repeats domain-containing protein n=1 Tax=Mycena rosella TaxID=1033263 RepID=A0AAD7DX83_MYCRO|nr:hypothetical protein B0H17DRAFT_1157680 [Mycena rosella]
MNAIRIKHRAPAVIQITVKQPLREAQERQDPAFQALKQRAEDSEELYEYRGRKRKEFEERTRRTRGSMQVLLVQWLQYANWEATQNGFAHSRSVFERALDVDPRSAQLWPSYYIGDRAQIAERPARAEPLWYEYVYLEELLQNASGARQVFERWMHWEPDDKAWQAYIMIKERHGELDCESALYERWIAAQPEPHLWVKWGKFEEERANLVKAREVFQTVVALYGNDEKQVEKAQAVFGAFAKMETRLKEYERARVIYKFALARIPRSKPSALYAAYTTFENTVLSKRRLQYEEQLAQDERNYDDLRNEDKEIDASVHVRGVYERAVSQLPPGDEKRHWRRYMFLWLDYALLEEVGTKDYGRARQIYQAAVKLLPYKHFTFAKLWLMFAKFEIRRLDLHAARKLLDVAIGMCPKEELFKGYIELEMELREFDRARQLYEKYLEFDPANSSAWIKFAELESQLQDFARTRAIFDLGVAQAPLSTPELLWKAYIEIVEGEREAARTLYERLLRLSGHVKVWISYALFEAEPIPVPRALRGDEEDEKGDMRVIEGNAGLARRVFERAYEDLKSRGMKSERVALLEIWKTFEERNGSADDVEKVRGMMPVGEIVADGRSRTDWDMVFVDDNEGSMFELLRNAHAWKNAPV